MRIFRKTAYIMIIVATLISILTVAPCYQAQPVQADTAHLILFWDGGSAPDGWTCISNDDGEPFYNRFPRGNDSYGGQGGSDKHTHSATDLELDSDYWYAFMGKKDWFGSTSEPSLLHTHHVDSTDFSEESNYPPYRSLKVIRCDSGTPSQLPAGIIAPFVQSPPAGWTRQSAQDNLYIIGGASVETGGCEAHSHHGTIRTTYVRGDTEKITPGFFPIAPFHHIHEIKLTVDDITWQSNKPPYVTVILAKADAATASIPGGLVGLFDDQPPPSWKVRSNSGQSFYQRFMEGDTIWGLTGGRTTHSHMLKPKTEKRTTGYSEGVTSAFTDSGATRSPKLMVFVLHKHYLKDISFSEENNMPPYTDVIIASYAPGPPVMITKDPGHIDEDAAILVGQVEYIGDTTIVERGFDWDNHRGPYSHSVSEEGTFGAGDYSLTINGLEPGTIYYYSAKAKNALFDIFAYGNENRLLTRPYSPTNFSADAGDGLVRLSWNIGQGATMTLVRRSTAHYPTDINDGDYVYEGYGPYWHDDGLTNGVTYYYSAWGEISKDTLLQYSQTASVGAATPDEAPAVATQDATAVGKTTAVLNGDITNASGGTVNLRGFEWDVDGGEPYANSWTETGSFGAGCFHYDASGLNKGQIYYYRARAKNAFAWGWGGQNTFITSPDPPTNFVSDGGNGQVNLTWIKGEGAVVTAITRSTTHYPQDPNDGSLVYSGPESHYTDNNLAGCTPYYYSAWSVATGGDLTVLSDEKATSLTATRGSPLVNTLDATGLHATFATINGQITNICDTCINERGFEWDVNRFEPYANSWTETGSFVAGDFSHALTSLDPNTTYYYRAKGKNNYAGDWAYGDEGSFKTPRTCPVVATGDAYHVKSDSCTLEGGLNAMGDATTVNVSFEWGTDKNNLDMETPPQPLTSPIGFYAGLTNLKSNTTYYHRAKGDGGACGIGYGGTQSFQTPKAPPAVATNDATDVLPDRATLNGILYNLGTATSVDLSFQYSNTSGMYSNETPAQTVSDACEFNFILTGLPPGTTFYYRSKADGGIYGADYGGEHTFTTGKDPPAVTTEAAARLTNDAATLNGSLTDLGSAATVNVFFQYGTIRGGPYTNTTAAQQQAATGLFQHRLTGLTSNTVYYYRAVGDGGINGVNYGDEASFRTGMFPPNVGTDPATNVAHTTSTLNGNLYNPGTASTVDVYFEYGRTAGGPYTHTTTHQAKNAAGAFWVDINSLTAGTIYYYRAVGDGGVYGISTGAEMCFTTSTQPPLVATDPASSVTASSATLRGDLINKGDAELVKVSFLWGTTQGGPYPNTTLHRTVNVTGPFQFVLAGLQGNTACYYRAKADGGNFGAAYGAERSFTTLKVPPAVTTDNATSVGATSAVLNGVLNSLGTASTVDTWFVYGNAQGGPYTDSTMRRTRTSTGKIRATINGLDALTTYYFRSEADGGAHGTANGVERSFTTGATPPSISTGGATDITAYSATVSGDLYSLGTATTVNVTFQYGTNHNVYTQETVPQSMGSAGAFQDSLDGLSPGITYFYRAKGDGGAHGIRYGAEQAFTTCTHPPIVGTRAATHMTTDTAALNGKLDDTGTATSVNVSFLYGTTAGGPYPDTTPLQAMTDAGDFQTYVTGLSPFTTYFYRAGADGGIYGVSYGAEDNFTTNRLPPVVSTGGVTDVMTQAATLNGDLHLMGSAATVNVSFDYGTTQGGPYTDSTPPQVMNEQEAFLARLLGLAADTTYYYRAKGDGGEHGVSYGEEHTFTTGKHPPIVVTIDAVDINAASATLKGDLLSTGSADTVNVRFEYATTQGGPYFNATSPQSKPAAGTFDAGISGLDSFTTYYYRAKADGGIYGTGYGNEMSFITPIIPSSVITGDATSIMPDSAVLNGQLVNMGTAPVANVSFLWGTRLGGPYPNATGVLSMSAPGNFQINLNGLSSYTTYYFLAKADAGEFGVYLGLENSFTTALPPPPAQRNQPPHGSSGGVTSTIPPIMPVSLPNVVVQSATLSQASVMPGDPIAVTVKVVNRGTVNGSTTIKLTVNGQVESVRSLTLESGKSKNIVFTTSQSRPGTYTVYVGGVQAGSFVVEEYFDPDIILFISMVLVFTSLVLTVMYVWRRRQQEY